jgi:hypothetical protein
MIRVRNKVLIEYSIQIIINHKIIYYVKEPLYLKQNNGLR